MEIQYSMVRSISYEDLTEFDSFMYDYAENLSKTYNRLVKVRDIGDALTDIFTIQNPALRVNKQDELVPRMRINCTKARHFYLNHISESGVINYTYIKISTYENPNYLETGLPLKLHIVNKISSYAGTLKKGKLYSNQLRIDLSNDICMRDKKIILSGIQFDKLTFPGNKRVNLPERVH